MYKSADRGDNERNNIAADVVANRGEDLRFPISSSSGFSSPFAFYPDWPENRGALQMSAGYFLWLYADCAFFFSHNYMKNRL